MADVVFRTLQQNDVNNFIMRRVRAIEEELFEAMMVTREAKVLCETFPQDEGLRKDLNAAQMRVLMLNMRLKTLMPKHNMEGVQMEFEANEAVFVWPDSPAEQEDAPQPESNTSDESWALPDSESADPEDIEPAPASVTDIPRQRSKYRETS